MRNFEDNGFDHTALGDLTSKSVDVQIVPGRLRELVSAGVRGRLLVAIAMSVASGFAASAVEERGDVRFVFGGQDFGEPRIELISNDGSVSTPERFPAP